MVGRASREGLRENQWGMTEAPSYLSSGESLPAGGCRPKRERYGEGVLDHHLVGELDFRLFLPSNVWSLFATSW